MTDQAMPLSKSLNLLLYQMGIFQPQSHVDTVPRGFVQPGRARGGEVEAVTPGHHVGALFSVGSCADHGWPHLGLGRGLLSEMSLVQPGLSDMQGCAEGDEDKPASPPEALPISPWGISVLSTGCVELNKNWPCPRLRLQKQVIEGWVRRLWEHRGDPPTQPTGGRGFLGVALEYNFSRWKKASMESQESDSTEQLKNKMEKSGKLSNSKGKA